MFQTCGEETLLSSGVKVERPAVVVLLAVTLVPACLQIIHIRDVGVGEGEV